MAERVGFEPTVGDAYAGFQDRYLQPLGHLSSLAYYSMRWGKAKDGGDQLLRKPWILSLSPLFCRAETLLLLSNVDL